jgi:hypothetical protein
VNVVEAAILVVAFIAAVYIAVQNFYTTVTGYVAVIEARTSLVADASPLLRIGVKECLITPYYAECCGDVKYFVASGFPALLIDATLHGYGIGYYLLVPSPSYVISKDVATKAGVKPLDCVNPAALYSGPASAFLVLPNGTVLISPTR